MRTYLARIYNANGTTTEAQIGAIAASSALNKARTGYPTAQRIEIGWMGVEKLEVVASWPRSERAA